jgi:hypothetical protein
MESFALSFGPILILGAVLGFIAGYAVRMFPIVAATTLAVIDGGGGAPCTPITRWRKRATSPRC